MKMKELLSDPSKWTQRVNARNSNGIPTLSFASNAVCFCLYGAMCRCYPNEEERSRVQRELHSNVPLRNVAAWNDAPERTHAEVLELVTRLDI